MDLALVLGRAARGAALAKAGGQGLDGFADVAQLRLGLLGRDRLDRRLGRRVAVCFVPILLRPPADGRPD